MRKVFMSPASCACWRASRLPTGSGTPEFRRRLVMVAPGPTALTVIPCCASSIARQRVKWSTAAFDTQYAPISQRGTLAAVEAVLTMRPPRASIIDGTTAWQQNSMLFRFTSSTRRQSTGLTSRMDIEGKATPALFTRTSIEPYAWRTAVTIASTDARWLTSAANAAAWPPTRRIASTVSSALRLLTSATATRAPCRANVSAAARPMPEPAPVIDVEDRAGDVVRLLRRQVGDGGRDVLRLAELPERHAEAEDLGRAGREARADHLIVSEPQHGGIDRARRHGI